MDKIKTVKIKNENGTVSTESYYISADARCVDMANNYNVQETIGNIDINNDGNIANQLDDLRIKIKEKVYHFDSVIDMKNANLKNGDYVNTLGYYEINDGGASNYKIVNGTYTDDGGSYIALNNGLFAKLIIENSTIKSAQFGVKADGRTDNLSFINNIINFIKGQRNYITLIFNGEDKILFSDTIAFNVSNIKVILETDLQFTKTENISTNDALKAIKWVGEASNQLTNVTVEGNGHYIDGNGNHWTLNNSVTSGLYSAQTISFEYINYLRINNIILKNGYKDCCSIVNCDDVIVTNSSFIGSYRDNGFSIKNIDILNPKPTFIQNCIAKNCRDLGFTSMDGYNMYFEDCVAINCGNSGPTVYDSTYYSVGGGFSTEIHSISLQNQRTDIGTTYTNCRAENCNNYGFYSNVQNCSYMNCEINGITSTAAAASADPAGLRGGHCMYFEEQFGGNTLIENCKFLVNNIYSYIRFEGIGASQISVTRNNKISIKNCTLRGSTNNYIIYATKLDNYDIENLDCKSVNNLPDAGIRLTGESTSVRGKEAILSNIWTNSSIVTQNLDNFFISGIYQNYPTNSNNPYALTVTRGTNCGIDNCFILSDNIDTNYAVRMGANQAQYKITNIYEGTILTNLENTIDSTVHD